MVLRTSLLASVAVGALCVSAVNVMAGGFAIREQSASSQGASFAGNAAGGDLSSMFWNPAAAATKDGYNTEFHGTIIVPRAEVTINSTSSPTINSFGTTSGDIGSVAGLGSSYMSYQFKNYDPNLFLALSANSPFGLKTQPDNDNYRGSIVGRESRLYTYNVTPTLAYRITPDLMIGGGVQFQYGNGVFSFATGLPTGSNSKFEGWGTGIGLTAGALWTPSKDTSIGLGWRSQMTQHLDGNYTNTAGVAGVLLNTDAKTKLELPDTITLSLRQSLAPGFRLLGTVEWSNWGVFNELRVVSNGQSPIIAPPIGVPRTIDPGNTIATLGANWSSGWFFALGAEYDLTRQLTVRAGGAYEISPIDDPTKRLIGIPDNNRIWASLGASYKWSAATTIDFAYSHIFVQDSSLDRTSLSGVREVGTVDAAVDIVSLSLKTKW